MTVTIPRAILADLVTDSNALVLYVYLLLSADKDGKIEVTYDSMAKGTGLSTWQVRGALKKIGNWFVVTRKTTNRKAMITICNSDGYEGEIGLWSQTKPQTKRETSSSLSPIPPITIPKENIYNNNINLSIYNKDNLSADAHTREAEYIQKWVGQLKTERYWQELVCMKHKILPNDILSFLDAFATDCIIRGKRLDSIRDVKTYFDYWLVSAIKNRNEKKSGGISEIMAEIKRVEKELDDGQLKRNG